MIDLIFKRGKGRRVILVLFEVFCFFLVNIAYYFSTFVFETSPFYDYNIYLYNSILFCYHSELCAERFVRLICKLALL